MATKQVTNNQQAFTLGEKAFLGIDTFNAPNRLQDGYFQNLQNLFVYGNALQPRNGWQTCWWSASTTNYQIANTPIYEITPLKYAGFKSRLVFTCNNKLYYWDPTTYETTSSQPIELLDRTNGNVSFAFPDSENVRMITHGRYIYGAAGGSNSLFRVRMNGSSIEAESVPVLDDFSNVIPIATAVPLSIASISQSNTSAIDTASFGSAPAILTNQITNGNFASNTATGFGQWNYNTGDAEFITSTTKTVGGYTYNVFSITSKNPNNYILTRDGTVSNCIKIDHIQDFIFQDIDVRGSSIVKDDTPLAFTTWNTNCSATVTLGNATISGTNSFVAGDPVLFKTSTVTNIVANTVYYVLAASLTPTTFRIATAPAGAAIVPTGGTGGTFAVTLPALITTAAIHSFAVGQAIRFTTVTGGTSISTTYYVKSTTSTTFTVTTDSTTVGSAFLFTAAVASSANFIKPWHNAGSYVLTFYAYNQDDLTNFISNNTLDVTVQGYTKTAVTAFGSGQAIIPAQVYYSAQPQTATTASDWQKFQIYIDFRDYDQILTGIQVRVQAAFDRGGDSFVYLDDFSLHAVNARMQISEVQDDIKGLAKLVTNQANSTFITDTQPTDPFTNYLANEYVKINLPTATDLRQVESISIKAAFSEKINQAVPPFSLGMRSSTKMEFTGQCTYDKDIGYLTFELFPISTDTRASVTALYFKLDYDLSGFFNNEWVISFGDVTKQGNLTPASKYEYAFTLWRPYTLPTGSPGTWSSAELPNSSGFETPPSAYSKEVVVTAAINQVTIALPYDFLTLKRGGAGIVSKYKYCLIYRKNILSGDNRGRLIGFIDLDNGTTYTSTQWSGLTSGDVTNTVAGVTTTQLNIYDQVQDSTLFFDNGPGTRGYRLRQGRDQFPVGCDSLAVYNERLFASKRNTIYASWVLDPTNEYGIYTTLVPDMLDPEVAIKGTSFSISNSTDQEQIQAMISVQGDGLMRDNSTSAALVIMREHSTYLLTGDSPHNFANQGFLQQNGTGLIAKRGTDVLNGRLVYVTSNGIMELQSTVLVPKGQPLEGVLNIRSQDFATGSSSYINASAYADIVLCTSDRRLYVLAPTAGELSSGTNTRMYIFDSRSQSWVNWLNPVPFTSLCAADSADDVQELYAGGRNGRLYKLEKFQDGVYSSTSSATARAYTPIQWSIKTRQYGQAFAEGSMYYSANKIHNILLHMRTYESENIAINWAVTGMKGYVTNGSYLWPSNTEKVVSIRSVSRTSDQQTFDITLSGSSSTKWRMYAVHAQTTEGNTPRI